MKKLFKECKMLQMLFMVGQEKRIQAIPVNDSCNFADILCETQGWVAVERGFRGKCMDADKILRD